MRSFAPDRCGSQPIDASGQPVKIGDLVKLNPNATRLSELI